MVDDNTTGIVDRRPHTAATSGGEGSASWFGVGRLQLTPSGRPVLLAVTLLLLVAGTTRSVVVSAAGGTGQGHYTDQWAVRVDGTEADARLLAQRHGFVYVDKVRISVNCIVLLSVTERNGRRPNDSYHRSVILSLRQMPPPGQTPAPSS